MVLMTAAACSSLLLLLQLRPRPSKQEPIHTEKSRDQDIINHQTRRTKKEPQNHEPRPKMRPPDTLYLNDANVKDPDHCKGHYSEYQTRELHTASNSLMDNKV